MLTGALSACSVVEPRSQIRGAHFDADQLQQLTPGVTQRNDAIALLGSPTAHATFDDDTWIYIGEVTRPRIGRIQGVESQNVLVLTFDKNGTLRGMRRLNDDDSASVDVVDRTTASPGSQASFMQQLLGNIGRYSPGGAMGGMNPIGNTGGGISRR